MFVDAAQIEVGEAAGFVAFGKHGFFKPGDGVVPFLLFDQIGADIVVRIAELGVESDGLMAVLDGAVVVGQEGIGPAAEGVGLGGREGGNGAGVEFDGLLVVATRLQFVGAAEEFGGVFARIGFGHDRTCKVNLTRFYRKITRNLCAGLMLAGLAVGGWAQGSASQNPASQNPASQNPTSGQSSRAAHQAPAANSPASSTTGLGPAAGAAQKSSPQTSAQAD